MGSPVQQVLDLQSHISFISIILGFLIVFNIIIMVFSHQLEQFLKRTSGNLFFMLQEFYKELMLLGIFSFTLFIFNYLDITQSIGHYFNESPETSEKLVEEVHLMLFASSIVYILVVILLSVISARAISRWHMTEQLQQAVLEHKYHLFSLKAERTSIFNIPFRRRMSKLRWQIEYHHLRHRFVHQQHLPHDYEFSTYLETSLRNVCVELVEIHWSIWMVVLGVVFLNWAKYKIIRSINDEESDIENPLYWLLLGCFLLLICLAVYLKCRSIFKKLVRLDIQQSEYKDIDDQQDISENLLGEMVQKQKLFWFNSPKFLFRLIQTILLFSAYYFAALIIFQGQSGWFWAWKLFVMLPPIMVVAIYGPAVLPTYCIIINLEEFAKGEAIEKTTRPIHKSASFDIDVQFDTPRKSLLEQKQHHLPLSLN